MKGWYNTNMNKNIENSVYVIYKPEPITGNMGNAIFVIPVGYYLVPYPLYTDKIIFVGAYLESVFVLDALLKYNPN